MAQHDDLKTSRIQVSSYLLQLEQLMEGGSWQGESFKDKLNMITATTFFTQPMPGVHSIAEIIDHCRYWKDVLLARFQGDIGYRDRTVHQMNFRELPVLQELGMEKILSDFYAAHTAIMDFLQRKDDHYLEEKNQSGIAMSYYIEGIIQHDIYHLGQVGLIQKILLVKS